MGISDRIEAFICELMKEDEEWVELGRNELAGIFNCVPSQINYVIRTRFTPERGYNVESRRGGGGYLKIRRMVSPGADAVIAGIPDRISRESALKLLDFVKMSGIIESGNADIISAGVCSVECSNKDEEARVRAKILKAMLNSTDKL